eukprot:7131054-Heterocapsa_arctica.AAC.1
MTPVDTEDMAFASTFEFSGVWERPSCKGFRQDRGATRQEKRIKRDTPERNQCENEGKHHS